MNQPLNRKLVASELCNDQAAREHQRAVAYPRHLLEVGRHDDDAETGGERLIEKTIDLRLGAHVDPRGRIFRDKDAAADAKPAADDDLLLVAARKRFDRQTGVVRAEADSDPDGAR